MRRSTAAIESFRTISEAEHGIALRELCPHATEVVQQLQNAGFEAYIVGGGVRDLLLGSAPKDFDVATSATPEQVRDVFPRCRLIGRRFRLAHVRIRGSLTEVATFRGQHEGGPEHEKSNGRILRDNVFGSVEEDAVRRDFTINAMFLDPVNGTIRDYVGGYDDLLARRLRLIGEPETRYREDPVRLLRAARFVAKLDVQADPATAEPISRLAHLLSDVPPARLFEEIIKLFLTGHGLNSFKALQEFGLAQAVFPALAAGKGKGRVRSNPMLEEALRNTDRRVAEGLPVTPAFFFAALLWQPMQQRVAELQQQGKATYDAMVQASEEIIAQQSSRTSIPRRFSAVTRHIWLMQPRLERMQARRWKRLLEDPKFRAAYDFLLLRAKTENGLEAACTFWTDAQRDLPQAEPTPARPRRRAHRRSRKPRGRRHAE